MLGPDHVVNEGPSLPEEIESIRFAANGIDVHALASGPADGQLVVLLHGFPELARSWRHQLGALGRAGYRAVAPDQRGYGQTTRRGPYDIETLSADVAAMIDALGRERAIVIGHDWGGGVAWAVAGLYPQRVRALVVANCPPSQVLARALKRSLRQLKKSLYMFFFQIPVIPERMLTANGSQAIGRSLVGGSYIRTAFDATELAIYQDAFSQPGAATAALNWYRAALQKPRSAGRLRQTRVSAPTLILWGSRDRFLGSELVTEASLADVMAAGNVAEIKMLPDAGHFVQNEDTQLFNELLLDWLAAELAPLRSLD